MELFFLIVIVRGKWLVEKWRWWWSRCLCGCFESISGCCWKWLYWYSWWFWNECERWWWDGDGSERSAVVSEGGGAYIDSGGISEKDCWVRLLIVVSKRDSSLKQIYQIHDPGLFQSGYSQSNHHKRDSQITRSKISYSLVEPQPLLCTPSCGYEFHALATHPHPTFTLPPVRSTFGIRSEVCGGAFLRKHSTC